MSDKIAELKSENAARANLLPWWSWSRAVRDGNLTVCSKRAEFLVKGNIENPEDFASRAEMCEYAPVSPEAAAKVLNVALAREPRRTEIDASLDEYIEHVGRAGESMQNMVRDSLEGALWGRWSLALLDRKARVDGVDAPVTKADEKASGIDRPYIVTFAPEDVLDWRSNADGVLSYVKLRTEIGLNSAGNRVTEYREVTPIGIDVWTVTKTKSGEETCVGPVTAFTPEFTAVNRLPVAVCQIDPIDAMLSRTPMTQALMAEKKAFRKESDISWDLYIAGHPMLALWVNGDLADIGVGVNKYLKLKPGTDNEDAEKVEWLEINATAIVEMIREREEARCDVSSAMGLKGKARNAGSREKGTANSGAQVAYEFEVEEGPILAALADTAQRFERDVLAMILIDTGNAAEWGDAKGMAATAYHTTDFGVKDPAKVLVEVQAAKSTFGPSHPVTVALLNKATRLLAPNMEESWYTEAETSNKAGAYEPPVVDFGE